MSRPTRLTSSKAGSPFGKFRLGVTGSEETDEDDPYRRRRARTTLSCDECHRSKVKCDRSRPCAHCLSAGRANQCTYRSNQTTTVTSTLPFRNVETSPQMYYHRAEDATGHGTTHWTHALCEDAAQYIFGLAPNFQDAFRELTQLKDLYPTRIGHNFPFSHGNPVLRATIAEHLPSPLILNMFVVNYFNTFEQIYPLFDSQQFEEELSGFQTSPHDMCDTWVAQLLMMLSLSCNAASEQIHDAYGRDETEILGENCLQWAAATLGNASPGYMDFPDLNSIRTLCMMVIAKSLDVVSPTSGGVWALQGFLVRLAMTISLHRDPNVLPEMPLHEANTRRQVWNTIVFLDLSAAIDSGLPTTIKPSDWSTAAPCRIETGNSSDSMDSFQNTLARAYPIVALVLSWINSPASEMAYDKVLDCDNKIRAILREADSAFAAIQRAAKSESTTVEQGELLQHTLVNTLLRRTLLALHRNYDRAYLQRSEFATSHWCVLECSLALLRSQHKLHEKIGSSPSLTWFADLFQSDFAVAMLHVISGLRHKSFSDVIPMRDGRTADPKDESTPIMARTTTLTALRTSFEITKRNASRSFHHFKVLIGIALSMAAFEASESGTPLPDVMESTTQFIVELVTQSKGKGHSVLPATQR